MSDHKCPHQLLRENPDMAEPKLMEAIAGMELHADDRRKSQFIKKCFESAKDDFPEFASVSSEVSRFFLSSIRFLAGSCAVINHNGAEFSSDIDGMFGKRTLTLGVYRIEDNKTVPTVKKSALEQNAEYIDSLDRRIFFEVMNDIPAQGRGMQVVADAVLALVNVLFGRHQEIFFKTTVTDERYGDSKWLILIADGEDLARRIDECCRATCVAD